MAETRPSGSGPGSVQAHPVGSFGQPGVVKTLIHELFHLIDEGGNDHELANSFYKMGLVEEKPPALEEMLDPGETLAYLTSAIEPHHKHSYLVKRRRRFSNI